MISIHRVTRTIVLTQPQRKFSEALLFYSLTFGQITPRVITQETKITLPIKKYYTDEKNHQVLEIGK